MFTNLGHIHSVMLTFLIKYEGIVQNHVTWPKESGVVTILYTSTILDLNCKGVLICRVDKNGHFAKEAIFYCNRAYSNL